MQCPICAFTDEDEYVITLHLEGIHFKQDSKPTTYDDRKEYTDLDEDIARQLQQKIEPSRTAATTSDDDEYLPCPEEGCGEQVLWSELQSHLDLHLAESFESSEDGDLSLTKMYAFHHSLSFRHHTLSAAAPIVSSTRQTPPPYSLHYQYPEHIYLTTSDHSTEHLDALVQYFRYHTVFDEIAFQRFLENGTVTYAHSHSDRLGRSDTSPTERSSIGRRKRNQKRAERLGKRELGPYAWEERMPLRLYELLRKGAKREIVQRISPSGQLYQSISYANEVRGIVPLLAKLLNDDNNVGEAWLCSSLVQHVFKMKDEGGFCGYRNAQMMLSYILNARSPGWDEIVRLMGSEANDVELRIPSILQLQDMIERAWELGYNSRCQIETGGIKNTRKYIGTPECQALMLSLNVATKFELCHDVEFKDRKDPRNRLAHESLFASVEQYFRLPSSAPPTLGWSDHDTRGTQHNVHKTSHPPIYLQQPGHSMTIVGFERWKDGTCSLLVLDPGYKSSAGIERELEQMNRGELNHPHAPRSAPAAITQLKSTYRSLNTNNGRIDGWVRPAASNDSRHYNNGPYSNNKTPPPTSSGDNRHEPPSRSTPPSLQRKGELPSLRAGLFGGAGASATSPSGRKQDDAASKRSSNASRLLAAYRRGAGQLSRHREFEILMLNPQVGVHGSVSEDSMFGDDDDFSVSVDGS